MTGGWIISHAALWVIVVFEALVILALTRQIGLLHRRLPASGARETPMGPAVGDAIEPGEVRTQQGATFAFPGTSTNRNTLLVFISTTCDGCASIARPIRSIAKAERHRMDTLIVSLSDPSTTQHFISEAGLSSVAVTSAPDLASSFGISGTPYAMLIDPAGKVLSKGIVNHLEHIESLVNVLSEPLPNRDTLLSNPSFEPASNDDPALSQY